MMTTFSLFSFRLLKISQYINIKYSLAGYWRLPGAAAPLATLLRIDVKRVPIIIMLAQSIIDERVSPKQIDRFNYVSRQFTMITIFSGKRKKRNEMLYSALKAARWDHLNGILQTS